MSSTFLHKARRVPGGWLRAFVSGDRQRRTPGREVAAGTGNRRVRAEVSYAIDGSGRHRVILGAWATGNVGGRGAAARGGRAGPPANAGAQAGGAGRMDAAGQYGIADGVQALKGKCCITAGRTCAVPWHGEEH